MSLNSEIDIDISGMCNIIAKDLNDWATIQKGIALVAEDIDEKVMIGFNNCVGPKCLIVYLGETPYGDEQTAEVVGWVKRDFDVIVQRGKILSDPRNSALTKPSGPSRPFYDLVDEARDVLRCIIWPVPLCYNPTIYNGTRPGEQKGWLLDSYIINISVLVNIGRPQTEAPELANGKYIGSADPLNPISNLIP